MDEIKFKCFPYELESIFNNLITNSVSSFDNSHIDNKEIHICVKPDLYGIIIEYNDTGIGLSPAFKKEPKRILEAFESDKRNENGEIIGTGMGMWIIARTVSEYNGTIDLSQNIESPTGFHIKMTLNNKK